MKKFLFIGAILDGQFVEPNGDATHILELTSVFRHSRGADPISSIIKLSYIKSAIYNNERSVVFYALDGTVFDNELRQRVFDLTKNI